MLLFVVDNLHNKSNKEFFLNSIFELMDLLDKISNRYYITIYYKFELNNFQNEIFKDINTKFSYIHFDKWNELNNINESINKFEKYLN